MATLTISKKITKGEELIIIPRKEYEEFLKLRKVVPLVELTPSQKRDLKQARKEYARGEYFTLDQLKNALGITYKKAC